MKTQTLKAVRAYNAERQGRTARDITGKPHTFLTKHKADRLKRNVQKQQENPQAFRSL